jgi:hypothetical protein
VERADEIVFENRTCRVRFGEVLYHLRGVSAAIVSFLRVPVRVERGDAFHLDRVDLSAARARKRFAEAAAKKIAFDASRIEEQLVAVLGILEERARAELEEADRPVFAKPAALSEEERREALAYLARGDLLDAIERDLTALGYIGESQAKKLAFLVSISRKLPAPLAAILRSSSGSGKSALLELVTSVAPPEDVVFLSELTPQALYYLDREALKHKLLVVDERAGSERADYPIRTLLSRQTLTLAVTVPDPATGRRKTRLVEVEGPVAYLESTTVPVLNPENTSRALEVFLDESPEQTRLIQEAQRARRAPGRAIDRERVFALQRNLQRCLEPLPVFIPWANLLAFPSELPRHRRDHEKFLRLIEAVTLLHQHQRDRSEGRLEATLADYRIAYGLFRPLLSQATEALTPQARDALSHLRTRELLEFTRRDLAQGLGWSAMKVWRVLGELVRADFVAPLSSRNGVRRVYRVLEFWTEGSTVSRLLPPEELSRRGGVS